ncbi:AAA family ATPase [Shouchella sp. JSM 1781072]|uniref:AAA family ATPase n=1 Tax=Shouchella sp. JSM 1781072 TaxID=3344581 RepID=UPI0035C15A39
MNIREFRRFKDISIDLGIQITCIAGHNAVGKSTLLGLLGHSGELKKMEGETLFGQPFRAHLNDIVKFSPDFDIGKSNRYEIEFTELPDNVRDEESYPNFLTFRTYWNNSRFKLIPEVTTSRKTEKKAKWPTLYLGLSRLYPVGESKETKEVNLKFTEDEITYIFENYRNILSNEESFTKITSMSISEVSKKRPVGLSTEFYDFLTNSAGQDNLGQILVSLLSFKRLKATLGELWNGGLLLIDEIDATLHPSAQNRLFDFLKAEGKDLGLQIVFTTHSLSLLEHISVNTLNNKHEDNKIELMYLTAANGELQVFRNPDINAIKYDLTSTYQGTYTSPNIMLYSEDDEARWFFNHILIYSIENFNLHPQVLSSIKMIKVHIGWNELLNLLVQDFNHFKSCIFLLDGDVSDNDISAKIRNTPVDYLSRKKNNKNMIISKLPGNDNPEKLLYNYIESLDASSEFFSIDQFTLGITKRSLIEQGPHSDLYLEKTKDRDKYKEWFRDNILVLELLFPFWIKDNKEMVIQFLSDFENIYNVAATFNKIKTLNIKEPVRKHLVSDKISS